MVFAIVIAIAVVGFAATYVIEARGRRRERALAEQAGQRHGPLAEGRESPVLSESAQIENHLGDRPTYI